MIKDLLWAGRWLSKKPLFALAIVSILALGIGVNAAVFSVVDAMLLRPVPYPSASRLVRLQETSTRRASLATPPADVLRWRDRTDLFEKVIGYRRDLMTLTGTGDPDQIWVTRTSPGLFSMLGARAERGRTLLDADEQGGAVNPAVITHRLWQRLFDADSSAVGKTLTLSGEVFTIVGVMPADFDFPNTSIEVWIPLRLDASAPYVEVIARTKDGLALSQAQSAMEIVARQLEKEEPVKQAGLRIEVTPLRQNAPDEFLLTVILIVVAVGLVLLIACSDAASLLLSRAVQRQKEIAIRASLGAGFWRVLRQFLAESLVVAAAASLAGIGAAYFLLQVLVKQMAAAPINLPHLAGVSINARVLLFSMGLCLPVTLICSAAPVFLSARRDLQLLLRGGSIGGGRPTRLFSVLIAAEAAFAMLLLVGSGLVVRSLIRLEETDHGIRPDHVLTMRVPIGSLTGAPSGKYDTKPRQMAYYRELVERLRMAPGVNAVAVVNNLPLSSVNTTVFIKGPDGLPMLTSTRTISPDYFAVMGIARLAGRSFTDADQTGAPPVVILNQSLARQMFPDRNPIGQQLPSLQGPRGATVVGVVHDSPQLSYDKPAKGELYLPYQQTIFGVFVSTIVVRTSGDPLALATTLRKEIWTVDRDQPIVKVETMNDVIADSIWRPRFSAWIFSILGALTLLLTSIGVYAVVAYTSALRVREVGIRVALGASAWHVVAMILRSAMTPLAIGLGGGVGAAFLLSRLLSSILYEIHSTDPITYLGSAALLLAIGVVASARPAWRAANGDPLRALRTE